jgi:outer membrane protein assembly factor BamB
MSAAAGKSFNANHHRHPRWRKLWLTMALSGLMSWTAGAAFGGAGVSWPMFQGNPAHTGYVPVGLNPANFALCWQTTLHAGVALNPVTEGEGKVFVSEYGYFSDVGLYALSATNGAVLWSVDYGDLYSLNPPSYGYGNVYIQNGNGFGTYDAALSAYQAGTSAAVFRSPVSAQWERYLAPTLYDGNVYVDGGHFGGIYSFNATNGTQNWFGYVAQYDGWTPAVDANYCYVYTGSGDTIPILGEFRIIDRFSGTTAYLVTDNAFQCDSYTMNAAVVLGAHNDAFAINEPGSIYPGYGRFGRLLKFDLHSDAANAPHIGWVLSDLFTGQPTLANDVLYVNDGGILVALDELTGSRLWAWAPSPAESLIGTIVATDSHLFVGTGVATYAIDLGSHEAVWSYPVSGDLAYGDGVLYVAGADGILTAITAPPVWIDPISSPGGPYTTECQGASTTVQLDGSASSAPNGNTLAYHWSSDSAAAIFSDPSSPTPILAIDATAVDSCTVTLAVSDGQRTNSAQALVTVVDTTPPTIQCGTNQVVGPGMGWSFDTPVATDACGGTNVTITVVNTVTNVSGCAVDVTRTWQATDGSGNSSLGSQTVTLLDAAPPTIQCGTTKAYRLGTRWNFDTPVASACDGSQATITVVNTVTNANDCAVNITRTWQATDGRGNRSRGSQTVTLWDVQTLDLSALKANPAILRPAHGQMEPVTIDGTVVNACGATAQCWIVAVADEGHNLGHLNNGETNYEITDARTLLLRAERDTGGGSRTYKIMVAAIDACGNTGTRAILV